MSFDAIFRNRIKQPLSRPMLAQGGEQTIVWSADASGVLTRLEEMERYVEQLQSRIDSLEYMAASRSVDLIPGPVDAGTFYELSSDGTLRAGLSVSVPPGGMFEIALFPEPGVKLSAADAYVDEGNPDVNHETDSLTVGNETDLKRSLVKVAADSYPDGYWDMPVIALLRLALFGTPDEQTLFCRCVTEDWEEDLVTWNAQPEAEDQVIDSHFVDETDTHAHFDVRPFLHRLRRLADEGNDLDFYGFRVEADEEREEGEVIFYSREGAPDDDSKPQLLYWFASETSKVAQGGTKENRLYGKPGGVYWFAYRMMDANNNPSAWSVPVKVTLPSVGDIPSAPGSAPTIESTNFSNQKTIVLSTTRPVDFSHYELEIKYSTTSEYIQTASDRLTYIFNSGSSGRTYNIRYRYVTRSGRTSNWSSWSSNIVINNELSIMRASGDTGTAYIKIDSDGDIRLYHFSGSSSNTYDYVESQARLICHKVIKDISTNYIAAKYASASSDTAGSTTSKDYVDRHSISLTPPGSGTALILLIAKTTVHKNLGSDIKLTFKSDGSTTNDEEAYSASAQAETVTLVRMVTVKAGSSHTFKLCYKSGDGGTVTVYRSNMYAIDLGRA